MERNDELFFQKYLVLFQVYSLKIQLFFEKKCPYRRDVGVRNVDVPPPVSGRGLCIVLKMFHMVRAHQHATTTTAVQRRGSFEKMHHRQAAANVFVVVVRHSGGVVVGGRGSGRGGCGNSGVCVVYFAHVVRMDQ